MISRCEGLVSSFSNSARVSSCACDRGCTAGAADGASAAWTLVAPRAASSTKPLRKVMDVSLLGTKFVVARFAVVADRRHGGLVFFTRAGGILRDVGERFRVRDEVF